MIDFLKGLYISINLFWYLSAMTIILCGNGKRKDKFYLRLILFIILGSSVNYAFSFLSLVIENTTLFYVLKYLFCFITIYIGEAFCFKLKWTQSVYYVICGYAIQHFAYSVFMIIITIFKIELINFSIINVILELLCNVCIFTIFFLIIGKYIRKIIIEYNADSFILPLAILLFTVIVLDVIGFSFEDKARIIMSSYAALLCLTMLYAMYKIYELNKIFGEKITIQAITKKQKEQYEISKKNIEYINIKCHDLRKQIEVLKDSANTKKIGEMEEQLRIYDTDANTGNDILDVILTEQGLRCSHEKIRFTYIADGKALSAIDTVDICSIFYNILDNAIEAVEKLPEDERIISLKVTSIGNMISINSYNNYKEKLHYKNGEIVTVKEDAASHGFGLKSIKMAVESYHGELKYYEQAGVFNINILIPII